MIGAYIIWCCYIQYKNMEQKEKSFSIVGTRINKMVMSIFCWLLMLTLMVNSATLALAADEYSRHDFPPSFLFGSATSAYQVEGAANQDGRSPSIWDSFTHGAGEVAVDGYHKYKEDVQLMAETGLDAYRFTISWSRLIPNGRGEVNPKGLQYYNNLINELVTHGIQVHVSLYNYDYPQALDDEYSGWISRKIVEDFTAYAEVCFREFGDRVTSWTTVNEPNIAAPGGYDYGMTPPGRCSYPFGFNCFKGNSTYEPYLAGHHMLLAHASTVRLYRTKYQEKQHGTIGLTLFAIWLIPLTNSSEDIIATQRARDFTYGWFLDPLVYGDYPEIMKKKAQSRIPVLTSEESQLVKGAFDFIGLIHYSVNYVKDNSKDLKTGPRDYNSDMELYMLMDPENPFILTPEYYPLWPWGLQGLLEYIKQTYGNPPVYIHENGQVLRHNTSLEDTMRVEYLHSYIGSLLDAIRNGSNTRGYFVWSFLDLYELLFGYQSCFGLYYVDYNDPELKRQPKQSAKWYSHLLKGGKVSSRTTIQQNNNSSATLVSVD